MTIMGVAREFLNSMFAQDIDELVVCLSGPLRVVPFWRTIDDFAGLIAEDLGLEEEVVREEMELSCRDDDLMAFFLVTSLKPLPTGSIQPHITYTDTETATIVQGWQDKWGYFFGGIDRKMPLVLSQAIDCELALLWTTVV